MIARSVAIATIAAAALIGSHSTVDAAPQRAAADEESTYRVQLSHRPAVMNADGSVSVRGRLTCSPDLYVFEYDVAVVQKAATGSEFVSGADLPCHGTRNRFVISVSPHEGAFSRASADIDIYMGFYDAANDDDLAAYDSISTRLRYAADRR